MSTSALLKRLEQLHQTIRYRAGRTIVLAVPVEQDEIVAEETREAVDEILRVISSDERDTVIEVSQFTIGGLPKLLSVT